MNLEFFVSNRKLTRKGSFAPVSDGAGTDTFTIEFDREWDGLLKLVELKNGSACAQVYYTGKTPLPRQVCGRGAIYLTCYGYRKKGDGVAVLQTVPMVHPVQMLGASLPSGSSDQPYTATVFEQMSAMVAQAETAAEQARLTAASLLSMKEAGAFTGPAGLAATVRVDSVHYGTPAKVENLGTENHARLRFTLPYKLSETEKQEMAREFRDQTVGEIEKALDAIAALQDKFIAGEVQV